MSIVQKLFWKRKCDSDYFYGLFSLRQGHESFQYDFVLKLKKLLSILCLWYNSKKKLFSIKLKDYNFYYLRSSKYIFANDLLFVYLLYVDKYFSWFYKYRLYLEIDAYLQIMWWQTSQKTFHIWVEVFKSFTLICSWKVEVGHQR